MSTRKWLTNSAQLRRIVFWTMVMLSWEAAFRAIGWRAWIFPAPSHVVDATTSDVASVLGLKAVGANA